MDKYRSFFLAVAAAVAGVLSACSNGPVALAMPDGSQRVPINRYSDESAVVVQPRVAVQQPAPAASAPAAPASAPVVVAAAVAASAPASAAAPAEAAASAPAQVWTVEVSDGSLSRALRRWAVAANRPLVWEAPKDKPAFHAEYTGDFEEAITKVMRDTRRTDYRLHACGYDNVVRVLHETQPCKR